MLSRTIAHGRFAILYCRTICNVHTPRRRRQREESNRWRTQQIAAANAISVKSLSVLRGGPREDDWSFNPLGTSSGYRDKTSIDYDNADEGLDVFVDGHIASTLEGSGDFQRRYRSPEEVASFTKLPSAASPPSPSVFPTSSMDESTEKKIESLKDPRSSRYGPQQHVFAPPGKVSPRRTHRLR